ncbi:MAG TPA: TetR family transcriptional regulator [Streptosporangiaceae bacterium]
MSDGEAGLRQRKKERTRRAIADAAMRLFLERGFDQVSILQIATAAEVAVQTVYNYFPAKGDLVFDEADEIINDLLSTVRQRAPGESPLWVIRGYFAHVPARVAGRRPPEPTPKFRRLVSDSATLRSYQREVFARFERSLAALLAEETGQPHDAVEPFIAAAGLVSVFRVNLEGRASDAEPPRQRVERALDLLERGLGDYAVSPAGPSLD